MDFDVVLRKRAMIRAYKPLQVEDEKIWNVLRNAWRAPSAGHLQPQDFVIVKDEEVKKALANAALGQHFIEEAPVVIVVCSDTRRNVWRYGERGVKFYSVVDGAFASLIILLTVVSEGLGACFVGAFQDEEVSRVLRLPKEVKPIGIISVGYPDGKPEKFSRIPLEKRVHYERW